MGLERRERIAELFAKARALDPDDLPDFLDRECGDDHALRSEILELLEHARRAKEDNFLGSWAWPGGPAGISPEASGVPGRYVDLRDPKPGGMGVVYRARDVELDRDVAYKVMKDASGNAEEFARRFAREAEITARLQYPGIVPVFGMVTDGCGRPAYAMGYIEGADFRELARHPGTTRERLASLLAACRIVEHAHKQKYVHGDLSLKNLMVADDGATHVVDWGLARRLDDPDQAGRAGGGPSPDSKEPFTPAFAAPSVRKGGPRNRITDVYSLGAVLATLVLGVRPDGGPDLAGSGPKDVPRALRAIIKEAMADRDVHDKNNRYRDAGALADDIGRFLDGDKVLADREPARERAWRSIRRHPARASVVVSSILLLSITATSAALVSAARERSARLDERATARARHARELMLEQMIVTATLRCEAIQAEGLTEAASHVGDLLTPLLLGIQYSPNTTPSVRARAAELRGTLQAAFRDLEASRKQANELNRQTIERRLRTSIDKLEGMIVEFPRRRDLLDGLATCQIAFGYIEAARSIRTAPVSLVYLFKGTSPPRPDLDEAMTRIEKGLATLAGSPVDPSSLNKLHPSQNFGWEVRALVLGHVKRYTEAAMAYDRSITFAVGSRVTLTKAIRLGCLVMAEAEQAKMPWSKGSNADHAHAIRMADYLIGGPDVSPEAVFNAACAFSLASLDKAAVAEEKERRARRAIALLVQIEEKDYFRKPKYADELSNDDALEPLRRRDDYRALVARVAKKR